MQVNVCGNIVVANGEETDMSITIDMTDEQRRILDTNATLTGMSSEEYALDVLLEHLEDEQDRRTAEAAYLRWLADPKTTPHEDLAREAGLR